MEKIKLDIPFAIEVCKDRFGSKPLMSCGVAVDQEVLDFLNSEKLGVEWDILTRQAKDVQNKKAFIARVRPDDFTINFEMIDFATGEVLSNKKTVRGINPVGEWECYVFRMDDVNVRIDDPKVDPKNMYAKPNKIVVKNSKLFFAPPKRHLFVKG